MMIEESLKRSYKTAEIPEKQAGVEVLLELLKSIDAKLTVLVERQIVREWYSVEEFARIVGRAAFTVRQWANNGRILASKKDSGRGAHAFWAISHGELLRFQREGLLPCRRPV